MNWRPIATPGPVLNVLLKCRMPCPKTWHIKKHPAAMSPHAVYNMSWEAGSAAAGGGGWGRGPIVSQKRDGHLLFPNYFFSWFFFFGWNFSFTFNLFFYVRSVLLWCAHNGASGTRTPVNTTWATAWIVMMVFGPSAQLILGFWLAAVFGTSISYCGEISACWLILCVRMTCFLAQLVVKHTYVKGQEAVSGLHKLCIWSIKYRTLNNGRECVARHQLLP